MAWQIKYDARIEKILRKLDKPVQRRISTFLHTLEETEDPRSKGKALVGNLAGLWRYRVGDYRIICDIHDNELIIIVIDIPHRSTVYHH